MWRVGEGWMGIQAVKGMSRQGSTAKLISPTIDVFLQAQKESSLDWRES